MKATSQQENVSCEAFVQTKSTNKWTTGDFVKHFPELTIPKDVCGLFKPGTFGEASIQDLFPYPASICNGKSN